MLQRLWVSFFINPPAKPQLFISGRSSFSLLSMLDTSFKFQSNYYTKYYKGIKCTYYLYPYPILDLLL